MTALPNRKDAEKVRRCRHEERSRFLTGEELMKFRRREAPYAIKGLAHVGAVLGSGPPKSGKTFLFLQVGIAVACGGAFLGHEVMPGDVLYLDLDGADRGEAASRSAKILSGNLLPDTFTYRSDCPRDDFENVVRAWHLLADNPRLVIVDMFENIRPRTDENTGRIYSKDYDPAKAVNDLANDLGIAIILLVHSNKNEAGARANPFNSIGGTNGLFGGVAGSIVLDATPLDRFAKLHVTSRSAGSATISLVREVNGVWRQATADERKVIRLSKNERAIVDALKKSPCPTMKVAEIADATGIGKDTIKTTLKRLVIKKAVRSAIGRGDWELNS